MQHRVLSWQADTHISLPFACQYIRESASVSEITLLISFALSAWPPSPSTSTSLTPTPWWRPTWSGCGAAPPPSSTWSGQSSAGATQTAGTCQVRLRSFFIHVYWRLWEILSELLNRWWLKVWIFSRVLIIEITLRQSWQSMFAYQLSQLKPFKRTWGVIWDHERK